MKRLGSNDTTVGTMGIAGATGVIVVFVLDKVGVVTDPNEASILVAAVSAVAGYLIPKRSR